MTRTKMTFPDMAPSRLGRYRKARNCDWTRRNAVRHALRLPVYGTRIDLSDFQPFES